MMNRFGFVRVAAASIPVRVGNPAANAELILETLSDCVDCDIVVFPELCVTGYTCGDLFRQELLLEDALDAVATICKGTVGGKQLVFVGIPLATHNGLFNCAAAIHDGRVLGIVPKQHIPNYKEFYESRWFRSALGQEFREITLGGQSIPFGCDLLFECGGTGGNSSKEIVVAAEICEDLWMPIPPSCHAAMAGANILVNLSASNETVAKCEYRSDLVKGQSGRCIAAYAYASAGPSESTTDLVFGGHCLIAENGQIVKQSGRVGGPEPVGRGSYFIASDVDVERLDSERQMMTSFADASRRPGNEFRRIPFALREEFSIQRRFPGMPFVPADPITLKDRCAEVFGIQCAGLARRLEQIGQPDVFLGISGGLDSTLALLVTVKTCELLGAPLTRIKGITMPGFGTTEGTLRNALNLMQHLGVSSETIDIRPACLQAFRDLKHHPWGIDVTQMDVDAFAAAVSQISDADRERGDLVFENVQARQRTYLLMSKGFVIGTGDLSEAALGWATYNGDHMSMYNVNCSIPKTLVRFLVRYVANQEFPAGPIRDTLLAIADTTISPELLPIGKEGEIEQSTEDKVGPYELHDFYLYHFMRHGFSPEKLLYLSDRADFSEPYTRRQRIKTLEIFLRRFFQQQYKRSCVPDGPKVGSVSLSPRGDWRMPSDADATRWLTEVGRLLAEEKDTTT